MQIGEGSGVQIGEQRGDGVGAYNSGVGFRHIQTSALFNINFQFVPILILFNRHSKP